MAGYRFLRKFAGRLPRYLGVKNLAEITLNGTFSEIDVFCIYAEIQHGHQIPWGSKISQ